MPQPPLTAFGQSLYDALQPLAYDDENQGWDLAYFCSGIASMFDQIQTYAETQDDGAPGWGWMFEVSKTPDEVLPWLAQFVGARIPQGLTDAASIRNIIQTHSGMQRGTLAALTAAIQAQLTGSKHVTIEERDTSPYHMTITVYSPEVPDQAALTNAILSQKPAGIMYTLVISAGETWNEANPATTWDTAPAGDTWDTTTGGL